MLGGNQFFDGAVSVPYNWIQHHEPFKTDMQIGPWSREKYNMMRTDISNDDFKAPQGWSGLYRSTSPVVDKAPIEDKSAEEPVVAGAKPDVVRADAVPAVEPEKKPEEEVRPQVIPADDKKGSDEGGAIFRPESSF